MEVTENEVDYLECKGEGCGYRLAKNGISATRMKKHIVEDCPKKSDRAKQRIEEEEERAKRSRSDTTAPAEAPAAKRAKLEKSQTRIPCIPAPNAKEIEEMHLAWAKFVFAAGVPFSVVDSPLFIEAMMATRPGLKKEHIPSRHVISTTLLDKVHTTICVPKFDKLAKNEHISLQSDTWKNSRAEKVFACAGTAGEQAGLIVNSGILQQKQHNAQELLSHLTQTPEKFQKKAVALISDGDTTATKANKLFKAELKKKNIDVHTIVCAAHTVQRMVNDCLGTKKSKGNETGQEFNYVTKLLNSVVASLKNVDYLRAVLKEKQTELSQRTNAPKLMAITRWTTTSKLFDFVAQYREALLLVADDEEALARCPDILKVCNSMPLIRAIHKFVEKAGVVVNLLQSDSCRIGFVIPLLEQALSAAKETKAALATVEDKQKMENVIKKIQVRVSRYITHEDGVFSAATLLNPFFQVYFSHIDPNNNNNNNHTGVQRSKGPASKTPADQTGRLGSVCRGEEERLCLPQKTGGRGTVGVSDRVSHCIRHFCK